MSSGSALADALSKAGIQLSTTTLVELWLLGPLIGFLLALLRNRVWQEIKFRKELRDNDHIDVSGSDWYAAWQTSIDGEENINVEKLLIKQKGKTVKIGNVEKAAANPKGGYLWTAQLQFFQGRSLMGWYFAKPEEQNASKGIMYLAYFSAKKVFYGRWTGTAYDGDLISGLVVIAKDGENAEEELRRFAGQNPSSLRLISHGL